MDRFDQIAAMMQDLLEKSGIELPQNQMAPDSQAEAFVSSIADIAGQYAGQSSRLQEAAEEATATVQFSVKGDSMYRGYYHPSPVQELIVTNVTRGRLTKKPPLSGSYYQYWFDADGNLLSVNRYHKKKLTATEYLVRPNESEEYGLWFEHGYESMLMIGTKTVYDHGCPVAFCSVHMPLNLNCANQFDLQTFAYQGDLLATVTFETGVYGMFSRKHTYHVVSDGKGMRLDEVTDC